MPRIDIHHLQGLAERPTGKVHFGELVRRLVYATISRQKPSIHFLAGESNGYAGWDGWVETEYEDHGVAQRHQSLWELSTDRNFESKFQRDFKSAQTKKLPNGWKKSEVIYVGLTMRSVTPQSLASIKNKFNEIERSKWGGIVLLAADDLIQWIEKFPSIENWIAEEFKIGTGRYGRSLEHWFSAWTKQTTPSVTEQLLTAGRDISRLATSFRATPESALTLLCDSTEEAVALIYCAIKTLPQSEALLIMASSLVVENEDQADELAHQPQSPLGMPTVILAPPATKHRVRLLEAGYRVLQVLGRIDDAANIMRFERANAREFAEALEESMGFSVVDAEVAARSVGSSVSIWHIRNLFSNAQQPILPIWTNGHQPDAAIAAIFSGAWREDSLRDVAILTDLAGMGEAQLSGALSTYAICTTPLIELFGSHRLVIAPTAAFEFIRRSITRHHIARLSNTALSVFKNISKEVEEHWRGEECSPFIHNPQEDISNSLRDGLSETMLRIAVIGTPLVQSGALHGYSTAQGYVDQFIRRIEGLRSDPKILASLDRQLPILMEAAPNPFLEALDALIQNAPDGLTLLLSDEPGLFGRSFHTGLLWGLEVLAWSQDLLPRVARVLTALARLDNGGQISNRPFNSLQEIFLPWHPGTSCNPETRSKILCSIVQDEPEIGWRLLVALLPGNKSISTPTNRPSWRNLGQLDHRKIIQSSIVEAYELNISLTLKIAESDPLKLIDLVEHYPNFATHQKSLLEAAILSSSRSSSPPEDLQRLWSRLHQLCRHHASFPDSAWALPKSDLDRLIFISNNFEFADPVIRHQWLFDDSSPDLGKPDKKYSDRVKELHLLRRSALTDILTTDGWHGVQRLLSISTYGNIVGDEIGKLDCEDIDILKAMDDWQTKENPHWLAFRSASYSRVTTKGASWTLNLLNFAYTQDWRPISIAMSLIDYPDESQTYKTVQQLGEEVSKEYWSRRYAYIRGAEEDIAAFGSAVEELIRHGRAVDVIDQNWSDLPKLGHEPVLKVIDAFISQPPESEKMDTLGSIQHDLQSLFSWLRKQTEISIEELARREYSLLPLLTGYGIDTSDLALHQLLREQSDFFYDVVCDIYNPELSDRDLPQQNTELIKLRARIASELLDSWKTPPGVEDGKINFEELNAWTASARELLHARNLANSGDQAIGKLMFYLPYDQNDGAFPPSELRLLLEQWRSEYLERGIEIEAFNSRGAYSKCIGEGGKQERELANYWLANAKMMNAIWPRAKALCIRISDSWVRRAEDEDITAQRDRADQSR